MSSGFLKPPLARPIQQGDPAQADAPHHLEEHQVEKSHRALGLAQLAALHGNQRAFCRYEPSGAGLRSGQRFVYVARSDGKKRGKCESLVITRYGLLPALVANRVTVFQ
jgi:hypothetical protein